MKFSVIKILQVNQLLENCPHCHKILRQKHVNEILFLFLLENETVCNMTYYFTCALKKLREYQFN